MTWGAALLAGLIAAPVAILWLGHRLRDRSGTARGAFWGGVIGHAAGLLVMLVASMAPPVLWEGDAARQVGVYWAPLLLAVAGLTAGAIRGRRRPDVRASEGAVAGGGSNAREASRATGPGGESDAPPRRARATRATNA